MGFAVACPCGSPAGYLIDMDRNAQPHAGRLALTRLHAIQQQGPQRKCALENEGKKMATEHDLTFVAVEKRPEVLRRIRAIEEFLEGPGRRAAEASASSLGLKPAQFYNLVKAWKTLRRPEALAGSGRPRNREMEVSNAQSELMDEIISRNSSIPPEDVVKLIVDAGITANVELPPLPRIRRYVLRHRPARLVIETELAARLIIDNTVIDMPVRFGPGVIARPLTTMVIDREAELVVGIALSQGDPDASSSVAALLDALGGSATRTGSGTGEFVVAHGIKDEVEAAMLDGALSSAGLRGVCLPSAFRDGQAIETLLGQRHGGLQFRPRLTKASPSKRAKAPGGRPIVDYDDAVGLAKSRIVGSNNGPALNDVDDLVRDRLETALQEILVH